MNPQERLTPDTSTVHGRLAGHLRDAMRGEARFDALSRTLYSTDASIYEIVPAGVALPRCAADVVVVVKACRKFGLSVVPRGAGTGLSGGAVGAGLQLDLSCHMRRITNLDVEARTVEVEPGVVLDELNAHVAPHGLMFAPDVATSSRATIGGMIANNACGARSIVYGQTVDHVHRLTVVLGDGETVSFAKGSEPASGRALHIEEALGRIRDEHHEEILRRFPKLLRNNGGYGLDRLGPPGRRAEACKVLCGSEGTLGIVVGAVLELVPKPRATALLLLHYERVLDALSELPAVLAHKPSAVELIDKAILDAARAGGTRWLEHGIVQGEPGALLAVEFSGDDEAGLAGRMDRLLADSAAVRGACHVGRLVDPDRQADLWNLRKAGLGLLMSKPGIVQPYAFVEDSAVDPARLRDYIQRFEEILNTEGVVASYYAHASVGCIHVKPAIPLRTDEDASRMRRIAEAACDLALEFGGVMTGEHGDGLVRSCWVPKVFGPKIVSAFERVKALFDADGVLNPGKIVGAPDMTDNLRLGPTFVEKRVKTYLDFSAYGGMASLAVMCSGVGACRQRGIGVMCPSFAATGDEQHTTRARANALRVALSSRGLLDGLDDPSLAEVMDLCLSCKACKSECPTGVDMARLKAEYLAHRHLRDGVDARSRFVADMPKLIARASWLPRLANLVGRSKWMRARTEHRYGLDRRIRPPRFATRTFRAWFRKHRRTRSGSGASRGRVVYFVDTWTNYFTPEVGVAAVRLLEAAGYEVLCPSTVCCGRPAISKGLLGEAAEMAAHNVRRLAGLARQGVPIVGTEPSCVLTLVDEYPQLVRFRAARYIADNTHTIESFLGQLLGREPEAIRFKPPKTPLLYHAHCHQKAITGSHDTAVLLRTAFGESACEIDSGCCGMAGSFGHEVEHYDIARTIGEERLFPAVRNRKDAAVAVSGFSCREHITHHTDATPRHIVEYLAEALRD